MLTNFEEENTTTNLKNCGTSPNLTVCPADRKVFNPSISASTNRIILDQDGDSVNDYAFDAAGNTVRDAQFRKFTYDAENKQTKVESVDSNGNVTGTIGEYFYDGDGRRVKKYVPSTGETTIFVYDAASRLVAEYSTNLNPTPKVAYLTADHLGSPRINTDENGAVISRHDYRPYGEETTERTHVQYASDTIRKQFTGYERDNETDLDFAEARYYGYGHGRFTSPDPLMASATRSNPQTFNRYSYVANNPLNYVDPSGMLGCPPDNPNCGPTTGGIRIQNPCNIGTPGCNPVNLGTVEVTDTSPAPIIETTTANISTAITPRPIPAPAPTPVYPTGGTYTDLSFSGRGFVNSLSGAGLFIGAGALAGTEEFPGPGTVVGGLIGLGAGCILIASSTIIVQEVPYAIPTTATPSNSMTDLIRAVSPAELADITSSGGRFRIPPGGIEGKPFSLTAAGAISFANQVVGTSLYEGPYTLVGTQIPTNLITPNMRANVDRGIPEVVVPGPLLPTLTPARILGPIPTQPR